MARGGAVPSDPAMTLPEILTIDQVCLLLDVGETSVRHSMEYGDMPYRRVGPRTIRFSKTAVIRWLGEGESVAELGGIKRGMTDAPRRAQAR